MQIEVALVPVAGRQFGVDHGVDGGLPGVDEGRKLGAGPGKPLRVTRGDVEQHIGIHEDHASVLSAGRGHDLISGQFRGGGTNGFGQPRVEGRRSASAALARFHLKGILPRHELYFGAGMQPKALPQCLGDSNLTFDGDIHVQVLPHTVLPGKLLLPARILIEPPLTRCDYELTALRDQGTEYSRGPPNGTPKRHAPWRLAMLECRNGAAGPLP